MELGELRNLARYRMRRGLLELDIIMTGFKEKDFLALDRDGLEVLCRMLDWDDPVLMRAIDGTDEVDPEYAGIVELIRRSHGRELKGLSGTREDGSGG